MRPLRLAAVLLALALPVSPVSSAQAASPQAGNSSAPTLHVTTKIVLVDVVVTDHGNAVHGLDRAKFHVYEDGQKQDIVYFDEHRGNSGASAAPPRATQSPLPENTWTNAAEPATTDVANVLLLDTLNTAWRDQTWMRQQILECMRTMKPGASLAIFGLGDHLQMLQGFTSDASLWAKAVTKSGGVTESVAEQDASTDHAINQGALNAIGGMGQPMSAGMTKFLAHMQQTEADNTAEATDRRVQITLEAMQQLALYLGGIAGRKNLIWFSGSFPLFLTPGDPLDDRDSQQTGSPQDEFAAMRNYSSAMEKTGEMLAAARVAVYPVYAAGLQGLPSADASNRSNPRIGHMLKYGVGPKNSPTSGNEDDAQFLNDTIQAHNSMRQIAEQTGGEAWLYTNGLADAMAKSMEDGANYYTIGYVPQNTNFDGRFRQISVRLEDSHADLAWRRGYYADPPDAPPATHPGEVPLMAEETMHGAPPATEIRFRAQVLTPGNPLLKGAQLPAGPAGELAATLKGPLQRYVVNLNVDPHDIDYQTTPAGYQAVLEFVLVAWDENGKRLNYQDAGLQMKVGASQLAQAMDGSIPVRMVLDVPRGPCWLRVVVRDVRAQHFGSLEIPLADGKD